MQAGSRDCFGRSAPGAQTATLFSVLSCSALSRAPCSCQRSQLHNPQRMRACSCCLPVQAERGIALCLLGMLRRSVAQVGRSCWLEPRLDGALLDISQPRDVVLPARGMLTLGLAELRDVPAGAQPLSQQQLEAMLQVGWACFKSA